MGTFTGARRYVLHTFATTQSALMKKRVSRYMEARLCPVCEGKRLKREALSVTFAGVDIGELSQMPLDARGRSCCSRPRAATAHAHAGGEALEREGNAKRDRAARRGRQAAHAAAPDVRRTPDLSEEKRLAAQRIAQDLIARLRPCRRWAWATCRWTAPRPRSRPASCSACAWPPSCAPTCSAWSTCSTSPPPACIRPTARRCARAGTAASDAGNSVFVVEHDLD